MLDLNFTKKLKMGRNYCFSEVMTFRETNDLNSVIGDLIFGVDGIWIGIICVDEKIEESDLDIYFQEKYDANLGAQLLNESIPMEEGSVYTKAIVADSLIDAMDRVLKSLGLMSMSLTDVNNEFQKLVNYFEQSERKYPGFILNPDFAQQFTEGLKREHENNGLGLSLNFLVCLPEKYFTTFSNSGYSFPTQFDVVLRALSKEEVYQKYPVVVQDYYDLKDEFEKYKTKNFEKELLIVTEAQHDSTLQFDNMNVKQFQELKSILNKTKASVKGSDNTIKKQLIGDMEKEDDRLKAIKKEDNESQR